MSTIMAQVPYKMLLLKRAKKKKRQQIQLKCLDIGEIVENGDYFLRHIDVAR